jgi:hypothetical protein
MRGTRNFAIFGLGAVFAAALSATALTPMTARAADAVLSGTIKSASGEALGGVTVSARADGSNIVTSVFTDESGNYWGPRKMVKGRQATQICPPMIPFCSRFNSVLFSPKMPAIAGCFNFSRSPIVVPPLSAP